MFKNEKYELGAPMTGYLLCTVILLFGGFQCISAATKILDVQSYSVIALLLGVLILIIGFLCLRNSYFLDGVSFILVAIFAICISMEGFFNIVVVGDTLEIVMAIVFILVAYFAFMANDDMVAYSDLMWAVLLILSLSFFSNYTVIACGIAAIILAIIEAYMCYSDWKMIQEMSANYEGRLVLKKKNQ